METVTVADVFQARRELRDVLKAGHGVPARGVMRGRAGPQIDTPFGSAEPVEGDTVEALPVTPGDVEPAAFADGIQRYSIESWVDGMPVIRGYAAAAVLERRAGELRPFQPPASEEFVVAPLERLPPALRDDLETIALPLYDSGVNDRAHPLEDLRRCALQVERRRRRLERRVCEHFQSAHPDRWLVVDGALRGMEGVPGAERRLGLIKSHETQFLAGVDLTTAITLPVGYRTSVFRREGVEGDPVMTWYVRLWEWAGEDLLFGLVRLERPVGATVVPDADRVSGWILAERVPVADDPRWDRLVYPMHRVEEYLRARAGGWA